MSFHRKPYMYRAIGKIQHKQVLFPQFIIRLHICCALCYAAIKHRTLLGSRICKKSSSNYTGNSWISNISHPHLLQSWLIIRLTSNDKKREIKKLFHCSRIFCLYIFFPLTFRMFWRAKTQNWAKAKLELINTLTVVSLKM